MDKDKSSFSWLAFRPVEVIFWLAIISTALFINISPKAISSTNLLFMVVFLTAFLIIITGRIWIHLTSLLKKLILITTVAAVIIVAFYLLNQGASQTLTFHYLPLMISISMAILLIVEPRSLVILLIIACLLLLGEAFWNLRIGTDRALRLSPAFLRVFSLTLVTIFIYYLYRRQIYLKNELKELNENLKKLDDIKSKFVANVSHELRTPLAAIQNANILLAKKIHNPQKDIGISYDELLGIISSNIERQTKMVDSLLDLSRLDKTKESKDSL